LLRMAVQTEEIELISTSELADDAALVRVDDDQCAAGRPGKHDEHARSDIDEIIPRESDL